MKKRRNEQQREKRKRKGKLRWIEGEENDDRISDYISLHLRHWEKENTDWREKASFWCSLITPTFNLVIRRLFFIWKMVSSTGCYNFFSQSVSVFLFVTLSIHHIKGIIIKCNAWVPWNRIISTNLPFQSFAFNKNSIRIILPNVAALEWIYVHIEVRHISTNNLSQIANHSMETFD